MLRDEYQCDAAGLTRHSGCTVSAHSGLSLIRFHSLPFHVRVIGLKRDGRADEKAVVTDVYSAGKGRGMMPLQPEKLETKPIFLSPQVAFKNSLKFDRFRDVDAEQSQFRRGRARLERLAAGRSTRPGYSRMARYWSEPASGGSVGIRLAGIPFGLSRGWSADAIPSHRGESFEIHGKRDPGHVGRGVEV